LKSSGGSKHRNTADHDPEREAPDPRGDKLRESCGVFGVYLDDPGRDAAALVYYGLLALQHRGQESAGIAVTQGRTIEVRKGMGLTTEVFSPETLDQLKGNAAVGHVRYATAGSSTIENAQPFVSRFKLGSIAEAHNGTLTNADVIRELLEDAGIGFTASSDSEVIVNLIAKNYRKGLERALTDTIKFIKGSYALAVLTGEALVGARDPNGIRPLGLGKLPGAAGPPGAEGSSGIEGAPDPKGPPPSAPGDGPEGGGWILASESCAIDAVGGEFIRDIEPGELVIISRGQVLSFIFTEKTRRAVCSFEYVYFARPDSIIDQTDVYGSRVRAGEILGRESAAPADLVIGVPDSGIPAAIGYGRATGTPFGLGIVKSKYVARTFIAPDRDKREKAVSVKHNVIKSEVRGKRVVLIDDSIVRGTTSRRLVSILRAAGAREVHIRICSPPVRCPCYFGIDTPHRRDLISNGASIGELRASLGADSLAFISVEGLLESLGATAEKSYCLGCFTGEYPIPVPGERLPGKAR
jgi:amidophosphoribosyltransferase